MAGIPRVEHFLFCFPLRSGILFLSSLKVVMHVVQLLTMAFTYEELVARHPQLSRAISIRSGIFLGIGLGSLTLNVLLITGVLYKKPKLFIPWLAMCGTFLGALVVALVGVTICLPIYLHGMPVFSAGVIFLGLIIIGCTFYVFCVVYTYYQQLKEPKETSKNLVLRDAAEVPYTKMA